MTASRGFEVQNPTNKTARSSRIHPWGKSHYTETFGTYNTHLQRVLYSSISFLCANINNFIRTSSQWEQNSSNGWKKASVRGRSRIRWGSRPDMWEKVSGEKGTKIFEHFVEVRSSAFCITIDQQTSKRNPYINKFQMMNLQQAQWRWQHSTKRGH